MQIKGESSLKVVHWHHELSSAVADPVVGIKIAPLTGDDTFRLYITQLPPHSKITPHYHKKDIETYQIVSGNGLMHTGSVDDQEKVTWHEPTLVQEGDVFTILPGMVHQLENNSDQPLILIFGCPITHLSSDRYVVKQ